MPAADYATITVNATEVESRLISRSVERPFFRQP